MFCFGSVLNSLVNNELYFSYDRRIGSRLLENFPTAHASLKGWFGVCSRINQFIQFNPQSDKEKKNLSDLNMNLN